MLVYLEAKDKIAAAQKKLEAIIRREFRHNATKDIGYPGGRVRDANVVTDGKLWFWSDCYAGRGIVNPRWLNWFGRFQEKPGSSIIVEINTALNGRTDQVAGFFAHDTNTGTIYLMHSGRVGGGTEGVGRDAFRAWYGESPVEVADVSGKLREGFRVMPVTGAAATRSLVRYVEKISAFKQAVRDGEMMSPEFRRRLKSYRDFYTEGRGRRRGRRSAEFDYITRHGDIVDALHDWRRSSNMPKRSRLVKDHLIDMGVAVGDELIEVYEVKPTLDRPSFYSALGQLMVHGAAAGCRRIMVLPHGRRPPDDCAAALNRWGIEVLMFKLDGSRVTISEPS